MPSHSWDQRRDVAVRLLARLSLVAALAVLGALFVGGAATSQASDSAAPHSSSQQGMTDQVRPAGLLLGAVVVGGGVAVLLVGAFRPPARREHPGHSQLVDR